MVSTPSTPEEQPVVTMTTPTIGQSKNPGTLRLFTGPMAAGKTEQLLEAYHTLFRVASGIPEMEEYFHLVRAVADTRDP